MAAQIKKNSTRGAKAQALPSEFSIGNVRGFGARQRVPIRPVTLLMGENGVGKTSFMACYDAMVRAASGDLPQLFDAAAFSLGAFGDVARNPRKPVELELGFSKRRRSLGLKSMRYIFDAVDGNACVSKARLSFVHRKVAGTLDVDLGRRALRIEVGGLSARAEMPKAGCALSDMERVVGTLGSKETAWKGNEKDLPELADLLKGFEFPDIVPPRAFAPSFERLKPAYNVSDSGLGVQSMPMTVRGRDAGRAPHGNEWDALRKELNKFTKGTGRLADLKIRPRSVFDAGCGVGQIYPVVFGILAEKDPRQFLLQYPETNLYPKAQAAFTSLIADQWRRRGHSFIIETHSDYIVDRLRICMSNDCIDHEDVVIMFFEPRKFARVKIHPVRFDKLANFLKSPRDRRQFFRDENLRLLGIDKL